MIRSYLLMWPPMRFFSVLLLILLTSGWTLFSSVALSATPTGAKPSAIETNATKSRASRLKQPALAIDAETRKKIQEALTQLDDKSKTSLQQLSTELHQEDRAIQNDLEDDEELSAADIGMLWEASVERSGTIRYAIEKLSHRDATGKPVEEDSFSKRVVQNLVQLGGVAGSMWTGTPASLMGSSMVQQMMEGNPQDSVLSRVTDADMVILAKEVEALQSRLITLYYGYRHAKEKLALAQEARSTIGRYYDQAMSMQGDVAESLQPLIQSIYDSARQEEQNAQQSYNASRTALALLTGPEAVAVLEQPAGTKTGSSGAPSKPGS